MTVVTLGPGAGDTNQHWPSDLSTLVAMFGSRCKYICQKYLTKNTNQIALIVHLSPPDCSCYCLATAATPLARWWWPLSSAPDNIHHHSMLLLCLWKPYLMNKCILMLCPAPDTALRCCGSKQAADWLPWCGGQLSVFVHLDNLIMLYHDSVRRLLSAPSNLSSQ